MLISPVLDCSGHWSANVAGCHCHARCQVSFLTLCKMSHGCVLHRSRSMCGKISRLITPLVSLAAGMAKQQKSAMVLCWSRFISTSQLIAASSKVVWLTRGYAFNYAVYMLALHARETVPERTNTMRYRHRVTCPVDGAQHALVVDTVSETLTDLKRVWLTWRTSHGCSQYPKVASSRVYSFSPTCAHGEPLVQGRALPGHSNAQQCAAAILHTRWVSSASASFRPGACHPLSVCS